MPAAVTHQAQGMRALRRCATAWATATIPHDAATTQRANRALGGVGAPGSMPVICVSGRARTTAAIVALASMSVASNDLTPRTDWPQLPRAARPKTTTAGVPASWKAAPASPRSDDDTLGTTAPSTNGKVV
jgi:hypothetical protein